MCHVQVLAQQATGAERPAARRSRKGQPAGGSGSQQQGPDAEAAAAPAARGGGKAGTIGRLCRAASSAAHMSAQVRFPPLASAPHGPGTATGTL